MHSSEITLEGETPMTEPTANQPQVAAPEAQQTVTDFCPLGDRNCKRFMKLGVCNLPECPITAKERRMAAKAAQPKSLIELTPDFIDVDMPFSATDLESATSPLYVECLAQSGIPSPYRR
jgi:hypothetical protein